MNNGDSLKGKTRIGLIWNILNRFSVQGIQFIFSIILARLLAPEDYGIIALPLVLFAIAECFIDSGFGTAIIRKPDLKEEDLSTAFIISSSLGVFFYFIIVLCSPFIASFYETPILESIIKITALCTLFNPLCSIQYSILRKNLDFKTPAYISIVCCIVSGITGVTLALLDYGVWALVYSSLITSIVRVVLLWVLVGWYPRTGFSKDSFNYLWGFGSKLLASGLLNTAYSNIYPVVIGKFYTPAQLGLFTRADGWSNLPSVTFTGVIQSVSFPVLSKIQDEDERLRTAYRKMIRTAAFIIFPCLIGLSALSAPLVEVLLTDKWIESVVLLQIICFDKMWYPIHAMNLNLLEVKGRSDLFLRLEVIKKVVGIIILAITIPHGLIFMCLGGVVSSLISLFINTYYTGKLINVGFFIQMYDLIPIIGLCAIMYIAISLYVTLIDNIYLQLFGGFLMGSTIYICGSYFTKMKELKEVKFMIRGK